MRMFLPGETGPAVGQYSEYATIQFALTVPVLLVELKMTLTS
jgi:hypothetical protein